MDEYDLEKVIHSAYSYGVGQHWKGDQIVAHIEAKVRPYVRREILEDVSAEVERLHAVIDSAPAAKPGKEMGKPAASGRCAKHTEAYLEAQMNLIAAAPALLEAAKAAIGCLRDVYGQETDAPQHTTQLLLQAAIRAAEGRTS